MYVNNTAWLKPSLNAVRFLVSVAMFYLCEYGCALWDEQCPCWHSCSSCTCTSHRRSSPGSPAAHQTLPRLACWAPLTVAGGRSARSWGRLETQNTRAPLIKALNIMTTRCRAALLPAWNGSPGSFAPHTEPEIMFTWWVCCVRYSWNSLTKSTGSVLISSISIFSEDPETIQMRQLVIRFRLWETTCKITHSSG